MVFENHSLKVDVKDILSGVYILRIIDLDKRELMVRSFVKM